MRRRLATDQLPDFLNAFRARDYEIIGPTVRDGAIVYAPISGTDELPKGIVDEQGPGRYRLNDTAGSAYFDHVAGPIAWKRYLYPPEQKLFSASGGDGGFTVDVEPETPPARVFLGVRACDLAAIRILDKVFDNGSFADAGYGARRNASLVVAVNCGRAGGTCFCTSMGTGPSAEAGYDIAMTEVPGDGYFVLEAGSEAGEALLDGLQLAEATADECGAADARVEAAANSMGREMIADVADVLAGNLDSPHWDRVASRCLNCANCTMACPTCFCSTVEDTTDLSGEHAERWRKWDSCFTMDFSYVHGGSLRRSGGARYRQWMTHKLLHWHEQFDSSGCVGCGRCITWCPVGIDITEEARTLKNHERRSEHGGS